MSNDDAVQLGGSGVTLKVFLNEDDTVAVLEFEDLGFGDLTLTATELDGMQPPPTAEDKTRTEVHYPG